MMKAELSKEIVIRIPNRIGLLSEVCEAIADEGATIWEATCLVEGKDAIFHIASDNNDHMVQVFKNKKMEVQERPVVLVEVTHQRGMFALLTGTLKAAGIDIHHFNSTALTTVPRCVVALCCSDNKRAVEEINRRAASITTDKTFEHHPTQKVTR